MTQPATTPHLVSDNSAIRYAQEQVEPNLRRALREAVERFLEHPSLHARERAYAAMGSIIEFELRKPR